MSELGMEKLQVIVPVSSLLLSRPKVFVPFAFSLL